MKTTINVNTILTSAADKSISKTTAWRQRKHKFEEERRAAARVEGLPTPKKVRMAYICRKCGQPQTKETGHSQYFCQTYCPNEPGQIPRDKWLRMKAEDEGWGAGGQESGHSVEVYTIPLMTVFFIIIIFLACIVKVHTISFWFNSFSVRGC